MRRPGFTTRAEAQGVPQAFLLARLRLQCILMKWPRLHSHNFFAEVVIPDSNFSGRTLRTKNAIRTNGWKNSP